MQNHVKMTLKREMQKKKKKKEIDSLTTVCVKQWYVHLTVFLIHFLMESKYLSLLYVNMS